MFTYVGHEPLLPRHLVDVRHDLIAQDDDDCCRHLHVALETRHTQFCFLLFYVAQLVSI